MDRKTLDSILKAAEGIRLEGAAFAVSEAHDVTFYLGQPGQAMEIRDVHKGALHDAHLQLELREDKGTVFVEYGTLHAVSDRRDKKQADRRTGF